MLFYLDQFKTLIQGKIYPLYLLSGDEATLLNSCQEQLYGYLKQQGFNGPVYENDATQLFSAQLSLFNQKEIIVHKLSKPTADFSLALTQYTNTLSLNATLNPKDYAKIYVLLTGKLDKKQAKNKNHFLNCLDTYGAIVTIWPPEGLKLKKWLSETADYFKIKLSEAQKNTILNNLANNLADIYQLLKIIHFCFNSQSHYQSISDDLLQGLLCHQPEYSEQNLIEALLCCDAHKVTRISRYLYQHQKILLIIWWLTQLFDWWQAGLNPRSGNAAYFGHSSLKTRAQSMDRVILKAINIKLPEWQICLFQLDLYAKNSQSLEAEYLVNKLLFNIMQTIQDLVYD